MANGDTTLMPLADALRAYGSRDPSVLYRLSQYFPSGQITQTQLAQALPLLGIMPTGGAELNQNQILATAMLQNLGQQAQAQSAQAKSAQAQSAAGTAGSAGTSYGGFYSPSASYGAFSNQSVPGGGGVGVVSTTATQVPLSLSIPQWQQWYGQNVGKTILVNGALKTIGQDISPDQMLAAFQNNTASWGQPTVGALAPQTPTYFGTGATAVAPETAGLSQMAQIDPASEAARQWLASSIGQPGAAAANMLSLYKGVDPTSYAMMQALGQQVGGNLALGSTLDPTTQMQIAQAARAAQGARGNIYGVAPAVEEALTQGQAGLALQQQRQQAAQSYLAGGISPGAVGLNLLRNQQAATQSYLGSGVTPYQAGAGYLANAINMANQATAGGPVYQPTGITQSASPYSYLNPTYGLSMGQQTNQMYNSLLQSYGLQQAGQQSGGGGGAAAGAAGGALSGAMGGAALGPYGALAGAAIGALAGGLKGYYS